MSGIDHEWIDALERTHSAVRKFARNEFSAYARKITYRMRRFSASEIFGDDLKQKTLWDEYCYEQHNGPTETLLTAWDETLRPYFVRCSNPFQPIPPSFSRFIPSGS
jgi:hypothetical protein